MALYTINNLKISAENERAFIKAHLVVQSHIENEEAWDCSAEKFIFDRNTQLHLLELEFNALSSPSVEVMAELNAMEGISYEATLVNELDQNDRRYRFTGGDRNLITTETDFIDRKSDYQVFQ
jgi:hypothetical protein